MPGDNRDLQPDQSAEFRTNDSKSQSGRKEEFAVRPEVEQQTPVFLFSVKPVVKVYSDWNSEDSRVRLFSFKQACFLQKSALCLDHRVLISHAAAVSRLPAEVDLLDQFQKFHSV